MYILLKKHSPSSNLTFTIPLCNEIKILGIIYNSDLTWTSQVSYMTKKSLSEMFFTTLLERYPLQGRTNYGLQCVYLAKLTVQYCNGLFVGIQKQEVEKIEKVSRKFHRIICGPNCDCGAFIPLFIRRFYHALSILTVMQHPRHILHSLLPSTLRHSAKFVVP